MSETRLYRAEREARPISFLHDVVGEPREKVGNVKDDRCDKYVVPCSVPSNSGEARCKEGYESEECAENIEGKEQWWKKWNAYAG